MAESHHSITFCLYLCSLVCRIATTKKNPVPAIDKTKSNSVYDVILFVSLLVETNLRAFQGNKMAEKQRRLESLAVQNTSVSQKLTANLTYMHRPPRIVPNYGKKPRGTLPKSNVSRVLLYDNVTQQQMLDVKISHIRAEQRKTGRIMDMHRK